MKRALPQSEIDRLERESNAPLPGTFAAMRRGDYPMLNAPSPDCGGGALEREYVQRKRDEAEVDGDRAAVKCYDMLLAMFIDESDAVM